MKDTFRFLVVGTNFISDNFAKAVAAVNTAAICGNGDERKASASPKFRADLAPADIEETSFSPTLYGNTTAHPAKITAVLSRRDGTGRAFCEKHSLDADVVNTLEGALQLYENDTFDAAYIASPNVCHEEQSIFFLSHGIDVLCEKPIAASRESLARMLDAAEKCGAHLMEAMRPAHDPAIHTVREAMERISPIRSARLEFSQYSSRYDRYKNGEKVNTFDPKMGNAALLDLGVYAVCDAIMLFGESGDTASRSAFLGNGFEAAGSASYAVNGAVVNIAYSKVCEAAAPSVILGEGGAVTVDRLSEPKEVRMRLGKTGDFVPVETYAPTNNMVYEIADFIAICEGDAITEIKSLDITMKQTDMIEKIVKSNNIKFN